MPPSEDDPTPVAGEGHDRDDRVAGLLLTAVILNGGLRRRMRIADFFVFCNELLLIKYVNIETLKETAISKFCLL